MVRPGSRNTHRRATIRDVAQLARVSVGTVSHVLNGSKSVSADARDAVDAAVAKLDYRPNSLARSLIARRPRAGNARRDGLPRLISVGYISIDYMVRVGRVPAPGDRMTSRSIEKMLGGPAANVAAFAAGLGAPFEIGVEMVTHLGNDADSLWALEELAERRIDASGALQQPGERLSRCMVLVEENGQRTIINEPFHVPVEFLARRLAHPRPGAAPACVHFDGFHLSAAQQVRDELHAAGYLQSMHAVGLAREWQTLSGCRRLLEDFDLVFMDQETFTRMCRDMPDIAAAPEGVFDHAPEARCRALLLTRGRHGACLLRPGADPVHCPAPQVEVVDATGAGDAFTGIFLASWLSQGDPEVALTHAVRGASVALTALGAQGFLPCAVDVAGQPCADVGA